MTEPVKIAWIAAVATIVGALLGRPVINQVVGTADRLEHLTEANEALRAENSTLQTRIKELEGEREKGYRDDQKQGEPVPNPERRPLDPGIEIVDGIKFQLIGCDRNGSAVLCDLQLTALDRDIPDVYLTTDSILNVSADEVTASRASLGSIQNHRIHAWSDLVARVPKKGALRFEGVGVDEDMATLLELRMVVGNDRFRVRFREVTLG